MQSLAPPYLLPLVPLLLRDVGQLQPRVAPVERLCDRVLLDVVLFSEFKDRHGRSVTHSAFSPLLEILGKSDNIDGRHILWQIRQRTNCHFTLLSLTLTHDRFNSMGQVTNCTGCLVVCNTLLLTLVWLFRRLPNCAWGNVETLAEQACNMAELPI